MPRGGYHPNAERWGRKSSWQSDSPTKTVRLPENLIEQVLDYAHKLDEGVVIDYETKAKEEANQLKSELEQMRQERDRSQELTATQANQMQANLGELRDRALAELKLGKQAPGYKSAVKALNLLITYLQANTARKKS
jgi:hypothetical protein